MLRATNSETRDAEFGLTLGWTAKFMAFVGRNSGSQPGALTNVTPQRANQRKSQAAALRLATNFESVSRVCGSPSEI